MSEERIYDQAYQVSNLTPDFLVTFIQNRTLSDAGKRALQAISDKKAQIAELDGAMYTSGTGEK